MRLCKGFLIPRIPEHLHFQKRNKEQKKNNVNVLLERNSEEGDTGGQRLLNDTTDSPPQLTMMNISFPFYIDMLSHMNLSG